MLSEALNNHLLVPAVVLYGVPAGGHHGGVQVDVPGLGLNLN